MFSHIKFGLAAFVFVAVIAFGAMPPANCEEPEGIERLLAPDSVHPGADLIQACNVGVRVISAEDKDAPKERISGQLSDIEDQLKTLPFSKFNLLKKHTERLSLKQTGEFHLTGASSEQHLLKITPYTVISDKVQLGVNWTGPEGETILSTQLKIGNGRSMLWGTESENGSTIMCVKVDCK